MYNQQPSGEELAEHNVSQRGNSTVSKVGAQQEPPDIETTASGVS